MKILVYNDSSLHMFLQALHTLPHIAVQTTSTIHDVSDEFDLFIIYGQAAFINEQSANVVRQFPHIPVLAVTNAYDVALVEKCYQIGIVELVSEKSMNVQEILQKTMVRYHIQNKKTGTSFNSPILQRDWFNILNNLPNALVIINHNGTLLFSNWLAVSQFKLHKGEQFPLFAKIKLEHGFQTLAKCDRFQNCTLELEIQVFDIVWENKQAFLLILDDVTEILKRKEQFQFFQHTVNGIADPVYWIEESGNFIFANHAACELLGFSMNEFKQMHLGDIEKQFQAEKWREFFERLKQKKTDTVRTTHTAKDGHIVPVEISIKYVKYLNKNYMVALSKDISHQIEYEQNLQNEHDFSQNLLENLDVIILVLDLKGYITLINRKGCELLGYTTEELVGQNWFETCLPQPEGLQHLYPMFQKSLGDNFSIHEYHSNEIQSRDGRHHFIQWHNCILYNNNGQKIGVLSSGVDMTETHFARQELELSLLELRTSHNQLKETQSQLAQSEKMASLGQLTSGIAHEINNPINFITTSLHGLEINLEELNQILELYSEITPGNVAEQLLKIEIEKQKIEFDLRIQETRQVVALAKKGAERTIEIVQALRSFTRLDEAERKPCDIHEALDTTLLILRNQWKQQIEMIKDYAVLPSIVCMPGKMNQVFINILSNAIFAVLENNRDEKKIWIRTAVVKKYGASFLQITFQDNGIGIPADLIDKIYDPFYTTKSVGKGTGLGLSISMGIIKEHHGYIEVESVVDSGTKFQIFIPYVTE